MSSRERFLAYLKQDICRLHMSQFDADLAIWQAAERQALERAAQICDERGTREAFVCCERIRALMQDASSEKEGS